MEVCKWDVCFSSVIRPSIHRTEKPKSKVMALWNWLVRVFAVNRLFYKVDNLSHFNFFLFGLILWIKFVLTGWLRSVIADYGVPLMVVVWTGVSYIPSGDVPKGIPRRLFSPNPWSPGAYENWTVIKACLIDLYIEYFPPSKWSNIDSCIFQMTGHAERSHCLHNWSFYSSNHDCCALLFWP